MRVRGLDSMPVNVRAAKLFEMVHERGPFIFKTHSSVYLGESFSPDTLGDSSSPIVVIIIIVMENRLAASCLLIINLSSRVCAHPRAFLLSYVACVF